MSENERLFTAYSQKKTVKLARTSTHNRNCCGGSFLPSPDPSARHLRSLASLSCNTIEMRPLCVLRTCACSSCGWLFSRKAGERAWLLIAASRGMQFRSGLCSVGIQGNCSLLAGMFNLVLRLADRLSCAASTYSVALSPISSIPSLLRCLYGATFTGFRITNHVLHWQPHSSLPTALHRMTRSILQETSRKTKIRCTCVTVYKSRKEERRRDSQWAVLEITYCNIVTYAWFKCLLTQPMLNVNVYACRWQYCLTKGAIGKLSHHRQL